MAVEMGNFWRFAVCATFYARSHCNLVGCLKMKNEATLPIPTFKVSLYSGELATRKIGFRELWTCRDLVEYNELAEREPTYERVEVRLASDVESWKAALVKRLKEIRDQEADYRYDDLDKLIVELEMKA
jgi:hypothetical protein